MAPNKPKEISWSEALFSVIGHEPPPDSLELRNSFIENCLADQDGNKVRQAEIHMTMQKAIFDWQKQADAKKARLNGLIRAPYRQVSASPYWIVSVPYYEKARARNTDCVSRRWHLY